MRHPYLSRAAARIRRSLGLDDLARRLDTIEARLAGINVDRYPNGPVYFGDHTALVATRWGAKMLVDTRDAMVAPWLVLDGLWESHVTAWLQRTLQPGQVFVDVGANIGYFTLLGASPGRTRGPLRRHRGPPPPGRAAATQRHHQRASRLRLHLAASRLVGVDNAEAPHATELRQQLEHRFRRC